MAVTTKMSVDVSGFKAGIQQAQNSVKTLDAELKRNEAQFKATGDKEKYMEAQTKALNSRIAEQQKVVKNAENALKAMEQSGVKPTDAAYQQMQRTLLNAQTAIAQTTAQMNALDASEQKAAGNAEKMADSLASIGKKVSLDAVISGVNSITKGLEDAAKAAISFASDAWGEIMEVAGYADDIATKATMYGMTPTEYQAMANLAATWGETSVEDIMTARRRIWKNGRALAEKGVFSEMGINPYMGLFGAGPMKNWEDLFWESGAKLMGMEPFARAEYGEKLFGRSWERLIPMFTMGRDEYERKLKAGEEAVISDEDIQAMATLNDTVGELEQKLLALEGTIVAQLAPALTEAAKAFGGLLDELLAYLKTPDGQEMLDRLGKAVTGLFEDLAEIDPAKVVESFVGVFEKLIGGLEWLWQHKTDIGNALLTILEIWGGAKLFGGALDVLRLVNGIQMLRGGGSFGGAGAAAASGMTAAAGADAGSAVTAAIAGSTGMISKGIANFLTSTGGMISIGAMLGIPLIGAIGDMAKKYGTIFPDPSKIFTKEVESAGGNGDAWDRFVSMGLGGRNRQPVKVLAGVEVPDNTAEDISEQVGVVTIGARVVPITFANGQGGAGGGLDTVMMQHANGIPWVPRDGYLAMLHRGERVLTAGENRNYTANSNLYIENMNMGGGMDAQALAAAMSAQNRRISAGFGS